MRQGGRGRRRRCDRRRRWRRRRRGDGERRRRGPRVGVDAVLLLVDRGVLGDHREGVGAGGDGVRDRALRGPGAAGRDGVAELAGEVGRLVRRVEDRGRVGADEEPLDADGEVGRGEGEAGREQEHRAGDGENLPDPLLRPRAGQSLPPRATPQPGVADSVSRLRPGVKPCGYPRWPATAASTATVRTAASSHAATSPYAASLSRRGVSAHATESRRPLAQREPLRPQAGQPDRREDPSEHRRLEANALGGADTALPSARHLPGLPARRALVAGAATGGAAASTRASGARPRAAAGPASPGRAPDPGRGRAHRLRV